MDEVVETKVRKRKQRAILSCNDCRRRKLKCDREFPCNRCKSKDIYPSRSVIPRDTPNTATGHLLISRAAVRH